MTKVIDSVLSIDKFEQQCVMLKYMLQSLRLKEHAHTIGIHPYLSNNAIYEHKCLENIKKLYKQSGKCDDQKQFKGIIEKPCARKSLCMFTNILDVNKKNAYRQVGAAKYKPK